MTAQSTGKQSPRTDGVLVSNTHAEVSDGFAFAFDIDGVLMKGGKPIPEGIQALRYINGDNPYGIKVYVLLSSLCYLLTNEQKADWF